MERGGSFFLFSPPKMIKHKRVNDSLILKARSESQICDISQ